MNQIFSNDQQDSIVPHSQLGLQAFNKTHQSLVLISKKNEEQRKKSMNNYRVLLECFKEKRREESKRKGFFIPESKAELICHREIAAIYEENQVDSAALIYSYQNFAHVLYMNREEIYKNNRIDLAPKRIVQAITEMKSATTTRQFIEQASVPSHQSASAMWANMFSILERINNIESHFSILQTLFHKQESCVQFACTKECHSARSDLSTDINEKMRLEIKKAKNHRLCVADTFFDQFYAPICFIRRNAFAKETQLTKLCQNLPIKSFDESCNDLASQLMDVHFLSIFELIHLAMSSLEHLAMLNPLPSASVESIIDENLEEKQEFESGTLKRKKQILRKNQIQAEFPPTNIYESAPEKVLYRGDVDANLDVQKLVQDAKDVRQRIDHKETIRRAQEQLHLNPTESERLQRLKLMLENNFESLSLQDGLHNRFSDERIEIFKTYIPSTSDPSSAKEAEVIYHVAETKKTRFGESLGGSIDPIRALREYFPQDFEILDRKQAIAAFSKYCKDNKQALLGRGKCFSLDKDLTATLVANFMIGERYDELKNLTQDLQQTIAGVLERKWQEQTEIPNFRAWSATLLDSIDHWLEKLQKNIIVDALYWSKILCGESMQHHVPQNQTFQDYSTECKKYAPWLFESIQSDDMKALLQRRSMDRSDDFEEFKREENIINFQFASNCKRLWPVDFAASYFNKKIVNQEQSKNNLSCNDQELLNYFSPMFFNREIHRNLTVTKEKFEKDSTLLWTLCCEPFFQGTAGFAVHIGEDPYCKDSLFAPNQKRDLKFNSNVQLHNYLWQFFRRKWSQEEHEALPQVAQLGNMIVDAYMEKKQISKRKNFDESIERQKILVHFLDTIRDAEQFLPAKQLIIENDILKICKVLGESLEESHNSMLSMFGYSTLVRQERSFSPRLFEMSRPYISLCFFTIYQRKRLELNRKKFINNKPVAKDLRMDNKKRIASISGDKMPKKRRPVK